MDDGASKLRAMIRARLNDHADALANGSAPDYPSYMKIVGIIEGLALAERDLLDLSEDLDSED